MYVRLSDEIVEGLDAWLEDMRGQNTLMSGLTRSDLIRDVVTKAVEERRTAPKGKAKR